MGNRGCFDDEHILQMIELQSPLTADSKSVSLRYSNYFDEKDVQTVFVIDWARICGSLDEKASNEEEGHHRTGSDPDLANSNAEGKDQMEGARTCECGHNAANSTGPYRGRLRWRNLSHARC